MGKTEENRGKRRAPKPPDHSVFKDFRQSKLMAIPIFVVIASLIVVPAASNWIPQSDEAVPTISPAPTLIVTEPSIAPTILPVPTLTLLPSTSPSQLIQMCHLGKIVAMRLLAQ